MFLSGLSTTVIFMPLCFFFSLPLFFSLSFIQSLAVRIDHRTSLIHLQTDRSESERARMQLARLGHALTLVEQAMPHHPNHHKGMLIMKCIFYMCLLFIIWQYFHPLFLSMSLSSVVSVARAAERSSVFGELEDACADERIQLDDRQRLIEQRKVSAEEAERVT